MRGMVIFTLSGNIRNQWILLFQTGKIEFVGKGRFQLSEEITSHFSQAENTRTALQHQAAPSFRAFFEGNSLPKKRKKTTSCWSRVHLKGNHE